MEDKVKNLQDNLKVLRMACGVSATEFGKHLGVTRQMISNLEAGRNKMTMMQYNAIMYVLDNIYGLGLQQYSIVNTVHFALVVSEIFSNEYKEYVKKGVMMYMPSVIQKLVTLDDVEDSFKDYIRRFDGEKFIKEESL